MYCGQGRGFGGGREPHWGCPLSAQSELSEGGCGEWALCVCVRDLQLERVIWTGAAMGDDRQEPPKPTPHKSSHGDG